MSNPVSPELLSREELLQEINNPAFVFSAGPELIKLLVTPKETEADLAKAKNELESRVSRNPRLRAVLTALAYHLNSNPELVAFALTYPPFLFPKDLRPAYK